MYIVRNLFACPIVNYIIAFLILDASLRISRFDSEAKITSDEDAGGSAGGEEESAPKKRKPTTKLAKPDKKKRKEVTFFLRCWNILLGTHT